MNNLLLCQQTFLFSLHFNGMPVPLDKLHASAFPLRIININYYNYYDLIVVRGTVYLLDFQYEQTKRINYYYYDYYYYSLII